jgi:hypothetical protein
LLEPELTPPVELAVLEAAHRHGYAAFALLKRHNHVIRQACSREIFFFRT